MWKEPSALEGQQVNPVAVGRRMEERHSDSGGFPQPLTTIYRYLNSAFLCPRCNQRVSRERTKFNSQQLTQIYREIRHPGLPLSLNCARAFLRSVYTAESISTTNMFVLPDKALRAHASAVAC